MNSSLDIVAKTYLLWMDFRSYGLPEQELHDRIYEKAQVYLETGRIFDPSQGSGFERMCVSTPRSILLESLERIARQFQEKRHVTRRDE